MPIPDLSAAVHCSEYRQMVTRNHHGLPNYYKKEEKRCLL